MLLFFNDNTMRIKALFLIILISSFNLFAQKESAYLLDNFIHGTVKMKNGAKVSASLNYDATNQNMMFIQLQGLAQNKGMILLYILLQFPAADYL